MVVVSQHWKWPNCRANPHLQLPNVGRLPALCQEYKAWDGYTPMESEGVPVPVYLP